MLELICTVIMAVVMVLGFGVAALCILIGVVGFIYELRDLITKVKTHIIRWNKWRKRCTNGWFHKFLVLVGLRKSPTMMFVLTDKEIEALIEGINRIRHVARGFSYDLVEEVKEDE